MQDGQLVLKEGDRTPHPGVSYDQQIVWDLFANFLAASTELGRDAPLREKIADARSRLLGPKVGRWGQLQEWMEDVDSPTDTHRHVSHLFALHPGRQISPHRTPALAAAARVSLDARGDRATGWSRAWKVNFWARLHDGDRAESVVRGLLEPVAPGGRHGGSYPNLFGAHPPFQMDSNFGVTAGIAEMFLQSHDRDAAGRPLIHLLPALPAGWPAGSVTGLRARGCLEIDLAWRAGRLTAATLRALHAPIDAALRVGAETCPLRLAVGEQLVWP
jgi:alpha-L-fucosidase 2